MKNSKTLLSIISTLAFSAPMLAFAASIQVSPARLNFDITKGQSDKQELTIVNPTADVQIYDIYADDLKDAFQISPESFTLEAGGRKVVSIRINVKKIAANENIATNISVVSKPLSDSKLNLATGAKIPVNISFSAPNQQINNTYLILAGAILLACLSYYLGRKK